MAADEAQPFPLRRPRALRRRMHGAEPKGEDMHRRAAGPSTRMEVRACMQGPNAFIVVVSVAGMRPDGR